MLQYPNVLNDIFDKLLELSIEPIIVGGYVRDFFLHKESKDIDIELYGISSYAKLENILKEFGEVNSVGKSFGVCKLKAFGLELDFSFPRRDSKVSMGHSGFKIEIDRTLDFKTATSRRDFTINSIGYSLLTQKFLDPFSGMDDLEKKILKVVDSSKFAQDPLRILRAVQFSARFDVVPNQELVKLCHNMIEHGMLEELPRERIFEEFKKLFLKSDAPSKGLVLLKEFGALNFFSELQALSKGEFVSLLESLDTMASLEVNNHKTKLTLMFGLVCYELQEKSVYSFLDRFTNDKKFIHKVFSFIVYAKKINLKYFTTYDVYTLATQVVVEEFCFFLEALYTKKEEKVKIEYLKALAKELNVLEKPLKRVLEGKDLIMLGLQPSPKFSNILEHVYEAQMQGKCKNKKEALLYVKYHYETV